MVCSNLCIALELDDYLNTRGMLESLHRVGTWWLLARTNNLYQCNQ